MDLARLQALEKIDPTPQAPWRTPAFTEIDIELDREKAKENASARQKAAGVTVFSDASGQRSPSVSNGSRATAMTWEMTQQTALPKKQLALTSCTLSSTFSHGRKDISAAKSGKNGDKNGRRLRKEGTSARLTRLYPQSARGGCMDRYREVEHTYSHNSEPATRGWRRMASAMASRKTTSASVELKKL
jgi:hypothetical protein